MKLRYWYTDPGATNCAQCVIRADDEDELARQIEQRRRETPRDTKPARALMESLRSIV